MKTGYVLLFILLCRFCSFAAPAVIITDKLMSKGFTEGRKETVDTVVLHFSSNVGAERQNPYDVDAVIKLYEKGRASTHYLIDRSGRILRLVREEDIAQHAGSGTWKGRRNVLNRHSIGIELLAIGSFKEMTNIVKITQKEYEAIPEKHLGYTQAQYTALKGLLADIRSRHPAIKNDRDHVIGHSEYAAGRKHDPGELFDWSKIGF